MQFVIRGIIVVLAILAIGLAVAVFHWPEVHEFIEAHRARIRFVSFVISPVLAILGFAWGILDKAQLVDLGKELGRAEEAANEAKREADAARKAVDDKEERIKSLEHDLTTIADSSRLWKLRKNEPFPEYRGWKYDPQGAKIITFGLFKGGVGKTHLAANFAAYVSERQQKPVLLVDLDYQGSLSAMMSLAAGIEPTDSLVDNLFSASADLATLSASKIQLARQGDSTALNGGRGLSRAWLVPASYTLAEIESRLLVEKVMKGPTSLDERYRLAHLLLHPHIRREFAAILLDTPPRMTLGTVNALVASHFYVVPAMLDRVSSEAVGPFLSQVEGLKRDLELDLRLAAIVPTMTRQAGMSSSEQRYLQQVEATAEERTGSSGRVVENNIPRKAQITNEEDLGYFLSDDNGPLSRFYDPIFDQIWERIHSPA